jgi:hypothetical protein
MEEISNDDIKKIIDKQKKLAIAHKKYYHEKLKDNEEYQAKARERSRQWYIKNNKKKKEKYEKNKEVTNAKQLYLYHKNKNNAAKFIQKYPSKYEMLISKGFILVED